MITHFRTGNAFKANYVITGWQYDHGNDYKQRAYRDREKEGKRERGREGEIESLDTSLIYPISEQLDPEVMRMIQFSKFQPESNTGPIAMVRNAEQEINEEQNLFHNIYKQHFCNF